MIGPDSQHEAEIEAVLAFEKGEYLIAIYAASNGKKRSSLLVSRKPNGVVLMVVWGERGLINAAAVNGGEPCDDETAIARVDALLDEALGRCEVPSGFRHGRLDVRSSDPDVVAEKLATIPGFGSFERIDRHLEGGAMVEFLCAAGARSPEGDSSATECRAGAHGGIPGFLDQVGVKRGPAEEASPPTPTTGTLTGYVCRHRHRYHQSAAEAGFCSMQTRPAPPPEVWRG